ncbi:MAG TPA: hypothetical protein VIY86_08965, partial [Pirellulaceae bacterium]
SQTYYLRVNGAALAISNVNNQVVGTALFLNDQGVEVSTSSVFLNQASIRGDLKSRNFSFRWNIPSGARTVRIRVTDGSGVAVQDWRSIINHVDPLLKTDLRVHWDLNGTLPGLPNANNWQNLLTGLQFVHLDNLQLNAPAAIRQWGKEGIAMAKTMASLLNDPYAMLRKPIFPGDSLLRDIFGPVSLTDLLPLGQQNNMAEFTALVQAIADLDTRPTDVGASYVNAGNFRYLMNGFNPLKDTTAQNSPNLITPDGAMDIFGAFSSNLPGNVATQLSNIRSNGAGGLEIGLARDARKILDLFLGRPTTIVNWQSPPIDYTLTFNRGFSLKPFNFLPGIGNTLSGSARVTGRLAIGVDNIEGAFLYVDPKLTEFSIQGAITLDLAKVKYGITVDLPDPLGEIDISVSAGFRGGIEADITAN